MGICRHVLQCKSGPYMYCSILGSADEVIWVVSINVLSSPLPTHRTQVVIDLEIHPYHYKE